MKSASNFPATAGSMKNLLDLYWPVPSVTGDLHVKTTRAKRKVDENSNFLAIEGSTKDHPDLHWPVSNVFADLCLRLQKQKERLMRTQTFQLLQAHPKIPLYLI